jgi:hypothetical protein
MLGLLLVQKSLNLAARLGGEQSFLRLQPVSSSQRRGMARLEIGCEIRREMQGKASLGDNRRDLDQQ